MGKSDAKTIMRVASRHKPYSQLGNAMLRDKRLTFEQRGVLGFILSHPSNWEFNMPWLMREGKIGRDRARAVIRALTKYRYCVRTPMRNNGGRIAGYEYVFSDEPQDEVSPGPENPGPGSPVTGSPAPDNQPPSKEGQSPKSVDKIEEATRARHGTDAAPSERLPFTATVIAQVNALGVDVEQLVGRYQTRTKGRTIVDPSAYLLQMAREEVSKRTGVDVETIKAAATKNRGDRKATLASIAQNIRPSQSRIDQAKRLRGEALVGEVLASLVDTTFKSQKDADRAFTQALANISLRKRAPAPRPSATEHP